MNAIRLFALLGLFAFTSSTAVTEEPEKPKRMSNPDELDLDKNGELSKAEVDKTSERLKPRLLESDTNKDGALDKTEFAAFKVAFEKRRAERAAKQAEGK